TPTIGAQPAPRIDIDGNRLTWNGQDLRLRGVAMGDPVYIRAGRSLSDYAVVAQDWAANCVRISVHPGHWRYDPVQMAALLDADVQAARAQGLFVVIDWHAIGFPGLYQPVPPPEWGLTEDAYLSTIEDAAGFWQAMARAYGNDPAIVFELWNEPVGNARHWLSNGAYWQDFQPAWAELSTAIRAIADNIILCAGGRWAHDLTGAAALPMEDKRTAYAWHVYPNEDRHDPDRWFKSLAGLAARKPIIVTEWGFLPDGSGDLAGGIDSFATPFVTTVLDGLGLGHTAWCYSSGAMPALLAADGASPSAYGAFVQTQLRASAAAEPLIFARGGRS
ncbi:MAG TPA: cellulase family glycosylhydrolase, partial [Devosia sp.]|nr:cellulase family glycosylhydrolase [Devosia sp.]